MNEILFRGKRIDNGEWIEGSLVVAGDYCCILPADETSVHPTDYPYLDSETGTIDGHLIPVDPSTVGQCVSGLTGKNGNKIFEGDIVKITHVSTGDERVTAVMYGSGLFGVKHEDRSIPSIIPLRAYDPYSQIEIIGNIHDNPELLEDKS